MDTSSLAVLGLQSIRLRALWFYAVAFALGSSKDKDVARKHLGAPAKFGNYTTSSPGISQPTGCPES